MVGRGQQAAADFDARRLGFGGANQPRGKVAVDLGELILVDRRLTGVVLWPAAAAQRPEHGENRRGRHQREHKPQRHQAGSGGTAPQKQRQCAALHHGRQAGQLAIIAQNLPSQAFAESPQKSRSS